MRVPLVGAAALLAVGALAGPAAAAASVGTGPAGGKPVANSVRVCADGTYRVHVSFPQQQTTVDVKTGKCSKVIKLAKGTTYANVYGYWITHPTKTFWVGQATDLRHYDTTWVQAEGKTTKHTMLIGVPMIPVSGHPKPGFPVPVQPAAPGSF